MIHMAAHSLSTSSSSFLHPSSGFGFGFGNDHDRMRKEAGFFKTILGLRLFSLYKYMNTFTAKIMPTVLAFGQIDEANDVLWMK